MACGYTERRRDCRPIDGEGIHDKESKGTIRVGIGSWTYEPWRGTFHPDGLAHKGELAFASRKLTTIEINGTFYRSQLPDTFAKWHDAKPRDVYLYVISGHKVRNPAAAMALIERLG